MAVDTRACHFIEEAYTRGHRVKFVHSITSFYDDAVLFQSLRARVFVLKITIGLILQRFYL